MKDKMQFEFSDTIAGYITRIDWDQGVFGMRTSDGREFDVKLTSTTAAELVRNLGEPYIDIGGRLRELLVPNHFLYAYGIFYPQAGSHVFEAKHIVLTGLSEGEYAFERPDWWIRQVHSLGDFYLRAQFPEGNIDWRNYRTEISESGVRRATLRQETDTISRLVYGFASAYLMTGDERYLEAAETGTNYLRDHMRARYRNEPIVYWYHAIDLTDTHERKIFASEFGDDYDAIPAYEQIYALAGPTQTYRITGDPRIRADIEMTVNLFDRFYLDRERGGYFSHLDPITFDPRSESLGRNRARKNWNSVGDHAPAYLINAWLATAEPRYADMLAYTANTIVEHFPDYEHSPFVQEKFHEDWSHDQTWGWQQNRAVVGHNLKIAWNLMRIHHLRPNERYVAMARKIAEIMPTAGMDVQRGGWYDVVERVLQPGEEMHRFAWHDRKAWWQQEQAILAYLILAGSLGDPDYLRLARESASFYNAWFLDHDEGGVYFNVLASGIPYLMGTERLKGSHSMSGYHSFELAYLAAVYTNLLITKQPMDFFFRPKPNGFEGRVLRVAPDILPPGSIKLEEVWVDGKPYTDFDRDALTVRLPASDEDLRVQVRIAPARPRDRFYASADIGAGTARLTLSGPIDDATVAELRSQLEQAIARQPRRVVLIMRDVTSISEAGVRAITFARQKLPVEADLYIIGASDAVQEQLRLGELSEEVILLDEYDPARIGA